MAVIGKKARLALVLASVPLVCVLVAFAILLARSPGRPTSVVPGKGGRVTCAISEKIQVEINGMKQGMFIKGCDLSNPVLLFMHGGTGMPEYFLTQNYPTGLERYFTVCWWDRRGAGLSYRPDIAPESLTIEQLVSDTIEVTNYLRARFHREKIYLMAHSGGTVCAILAAARAPQLYAAYIGVAQMTHQLKSEVQTYQYMLDQYKAIGDRKMVRRLEHARPTMTLPLPVAYMRVRDPAMHRLGIGTTHTMRSVMTGVFLASWLNTEYTLTEKFNLWRGKFFCDRVLWDTLLATDVTELVPELDLPVYFFHGTYDYTVSYAQAEAYARTLKAPLKGFYTFEQSAHSPMFEEPDRMREIFQQDVLAGGSSLADKDPPLE